MSQHDVQIAEIESHLSACHPLSKTSLSSGF
jgi:hypothetical protein